MRGRRTPGLVAVTLLLAAAPAHATDRFVSTTGGNANPCTAAQPCLTIQEGFDAAAASGDRIVIGAGFFIGHATTTKRVDLVGGGAAGPATTVLGGDDANPTVHLQGGGSVSELRIRSGQGSALLMDSTAAATPALIYAVSDVRVEGPSLCVACAAVALAVGPDGTVPNRPVTATIDHVDVIAGAGAGVALRHAGTTATVSRTTLELEQPLADGLSFSDGADGAVSDTSISGLTDNAVDVAGGPGSGPAAPERSNVTLTRVRADVQGSALSVSIGTATVADSLLASRNGLGALVRSLANTDGAADLTARSTTLYAEGASGARALDVVDSGGPMRATAELSNSIVRAVPAGSAPAPVADIEAFNAAASVTASHSSFTTTTLTGTAPASAIPAPGSGTNVAGDPGLVSPATGDFRLLGSSPLIDRGDPAVLTAGDTDLAGGPRSLDGNGDCTAAPDVGAFEAPARACTPPPPPGKQPDRTAPALSGVGFSPATFRVAPAPRKGRKTQASASRKRRPRAHPAGSHLIAKVSEAGTLDVTLVRCANKRCTRTKRAGTLHFKVNAGRNSIAFTGRIGRKGLAVGRYRASVRALDAAKNASRARTVFFTIVAN